MERQDRWTNRTVSVVQWKHTVHTFHFSNLQNQAIYLEILLVLQLNQVFYNGNMGESPRNEVLMIKNKKNT